MAAVHTRTFQDRKFIPLNEYFQPTLSEDDLISKFSLFLGTLARQCVPLTYVSWHKVPDKDNLWEFVKRKYMIAEEGKAWVLRAIHDAWKGFKSRIKKDHYKIYNNDVDRIKNKPSDIPLEEFKVLLTYWGNPKVQELAEQDAANRKKITNTHTAGSRSFTQISKKMQLSNENGEQPSKAEMFIATRKRKDGHEYKSPTELIEYKLSTLEEIRSSGANSESVQQLISGETSHWSSFLTGRLALPKKLKTSTSTGTSSQPPIDVDQLTARIEEKLHVIVEETIN